MAELADEDWIIRADHPVVEVLQRSAVAAGFEPKATTLPRRTPATSPAAHSRSCG